jgi:hypothetical protein
MPIDITLNNEDLERFEDIVLKSKKTLDPSKVRSGSS